MCCEDARQTSKALRDLAACIVRDNIDSSQLEAYMQCLLSDYLVELPAICRMEAMLVVHSFGSLTARDIAARFCEAAYAVEHEGLKHGSLVAIASKRDGMVASRVSGDRGASRTMRLQSIAPAAQSMGVLEGIVSACYFIVAIAVLINWLPLLDYPPTIDTRPDGLQLTAAAGFFLLGLLYAWETIRRAKLYRRSQG